MFLDVFGASDHHFQRAGSKNLHKIKRLTVLGIDFYNAEMSESVKNLFCFFKRFAALIGDVFENCPSY